MLWGTYHEVGAGDYMTLDPNEAPVTCRRADLAVIAEVIRDWGPLYDANGTKFEDADVRHMASDIRFALEQAAGAGQ